MLNALFRSVSPERIICPLLGAAEVVSVLVRKRNDGRLTERDFTAGIRNLRSEVLEAPEVQTPSVGEG